MTPLSETREPLTRPTEELPRPSSGPLIIIGGLLSAVIVGLGIAMWVGAAASLTW